MDKVNKNYNNNHINNQANNADESDFFDNINIQDLISKLLIYWPWFVVSILACLFLFFIYIRYQTPVYRVNASVLIKEDDKHSSGTNPLSAIQNFGIMSITNNFDNEIEILKSHTLIKKVVCDLGLYTNSFESNVLSCNTPLYHSQPVDVYMSAESADLLEGEVCVKMKYTYPQQVEATVKYSLDSEDTVVKQYIEELPYVLSTPVGDIEFLTNYEVINSWTEDSPSMKYMTIISSPSDVALNYFAKLTISPTSKTTTIARISVENTVKQRGVDFINHLIDAYNQDANDEKNEVARKTALFIDERLSIIDKELGSADNELARFKQQSGLTDLASDAQLALHENSQYQQLFTENVTQINLVNSLQDYINNPKNDQDIIPANVGLQNQSLTAVIDDYNKLIMERKKLLRTSSENNPAVVKLNATIEVMKITVKTTIASVLDGLKIQKNEIERQVHKFQGRISSVPEHEKEFLNKSRKQEIKATLYTMLLQKREENAITLAVTASNGRIIEKPLAEKAPVLPRKGMLLLVAVIVGVAIPMVVLYVREMFRYKIEDKDDVEKITSVPVIGELPIVDERKYGNIQVRENENDIMEEAFRALRTNLLFMLSGNQKVVAFTSSIPGEGKSFVTANVSCSLAFLGKKVIVVGMDIRKPGLNKVFGVNKRNVGVTTYLRDPESTNLESIIEKSTISPNLDILFGGPVPPNPTELVAKDSLEKLLDTLKKSYDYVVLDTAPISMVTDTQIISRAVDMCVYVCRADYTNKQTFRYINQLEKDRQFPGLAVVINAIDLKKRKNAYKRKHGYGYGYGYMDNEA
ncbi:MAG: polysaccharide biosynthesis tyrosine autokinase [Bacteroidales bacterium]|nr:polysaccharide biosynthesis tyrosine autokinase [Bacteroidales bacterium]